MIRCKACGYIMKEGRLKDRCPACGAPKTAFEPHTDPIGPGRRRILGLHLHPIAVHFPTTLAVALFLFSFAAPFFGGEPRDTLVDTAKILSLFLPLTVLLAFSVGWIDGVTRFRKIGNSHIIKRKILYAAIFFGVAVALAVVIWIGDFRSPSFSAPAILLAAGAVCLSVPLALLGMSIANAAFPGK